MARLNGEIGHQVSSVGVMLINGKDFGKKNLAK
jgi:hypothetical protein